jgi:hypothetical protein
MDVKQGRELQLVSLRDDYSIRSLRDSTTSIIYLAYRLTLASFHGRAQGRRYDNMDCFSSFAALSGVVFDACFNGVPPPPPVEAANHVGKYNSHVSIPFNVWRRLSNKNLMIQGRTRRFSFALAPNRSLYGAHEGLLWLLPGQGGQAGDGTVYWSPPALCASASSLGVSCKSRSPSSHIKPFRPPRRLFLIFLSPLAPSLLHNRCDLL